MRSLHKQWTNWLRENDWNLHYINFPVTLTIGRSIRFPFVTTYELDSRYKNTLICTCIDDVLFTILTFDCVRMEKPVDARIADYSKLPSFEVDAISSVYVLTLISILWTYEIWTAIICSCLKCAFVENVTVPALFFYIS